MLVIEADKLSFLRNIGAYQTRHSGRTLYEHLLGTQALLSRWGCSQVIRDAGLMHSVMGTRRFRWRPHISGVESDLAKLVSAEALRLIWLFSSAHRGLSLLDAWRTGALNIRATGEEGSKYISVRPDELCALILIEAANLLDQCTGREFFVVLLSSNFHRNVLPPAAVDDLRAFLEATRVTLPPYTGDEVRPSYLLGGDFSLPGAVRTHSISLRGFEAWEARERRLVRALVEVG